MEKQPNWNPTCFLETLVNTSPYFTSSPPTETNQNNGKFALTSDYYSGSFDEEDSDDPVNNLHLLHNLDCSRLAWLLETCDHSF